MTPSVGAQRPLTSGFGRVRRPSRVAGGGWRFRGRTSASQAPRRGPDDGARFANMQVRGPFPCRPVSPRDPRCRPVRSRLGHAGSPSWPRRPAVGRCNPHGRGSGGGGILAMCSSVVAVRALSGRVVVYPGATTTTATSIGSPLSPVSHANGSSPPAPSTDDARTSAPSLSPSDSVGRLHRLRGHRVPPHGRSSPRRTPGRVERGCQACRRHLGLAALVVTGAS